MKPGQANAKGGSFERWVCRQLTKWITGQEKPELFWRSATSGAKATVDARRGIKSKMGGDLIAVDSKGQWFIDCFSLECKDRADYGNLDLLFAGQGDFLKWWGQCNRDAIRANKVPMMIVKRLRRKPLLVVPAWIGRTVGGLSGPEMEMDGFDKFGFTIYLFSNWMEGVKVGRVFDLAYERKKALADSYLANQKHTPKHLEKAGIHA